MQSDTLIKDVSMNKIHVEIMINKIDKFKQENAKFIQWLSSIALNEYYSIFEQNGIMTFESFYHHIHSNSDLIQLLGDRNAFDVELLWNSLPKIIRQNSHSLDDRNDEDDMDGARPTGIEDDDDTNVSGSVVSAQIEGKKHG